MHTFSRPLALAASLVLLTGCSGWVRAAAGPSYSLKGDANRSGHSLAIDTIISPKAKSWINRGSKPLPVGLHVGLLGINTETFKSIGWTTGIALYSSPRPISPFFIVGTNGHVDSINGKPTFGNLNPYAEIGVSAQLGSRTKDHERGFIFTLSADSQLLVNNIALFTDKPDKVDLMIGIKYGIAYESE